MSLDVSAAWEELAPLLEGFSGTASLAFHAFGAGDLLVEADADMPSASLIKLPLLACALEEAEAGRLDLTRRIRVGEEHHAGGNGVLRFLGAGLEPTVGDLLTLMICVSDNTATNLTIDLLGTERIDAWIRSAGMARTRLIGKLQRPETEWNEAQRRGERNGTTAADVLGLLVRVERGDLLPPRARERMLEILSRQLYTEGIGRYLPLDPHAAGGAEERLTIHSKSGCLPGVRHDAGLVRRADGTPLFAMAMLTRDSEDRTEDWDQEGVLLIARCARILWRALRAA